MFLILDIGNDIFESHNSLTKIYNNLKNSLHYNQSTQLNRRGFAFLQLNQIQKLLKDQSKKISFLFCFFLVKIF